MPLYEVVLNGVLSNQQSINRFNYLMEGTPVGVTGSFACLSAIGFLLTGDPPAFPVDGLGEAISFVQTGQFTYIQASARNVYDPEDFYDYPYLANTVGQRSGNSLSPVMALGITSNRVRTDIRRGQKRFSGIASGDVGTLGALTGGFLVVATELAGKIGQTFNYTDGGNSLSFKPCVVSKEEYTTPSGSKAYRYYGTEAAQLAHVASGVSWLPKDTIRTQGSRQYGRGA